MTSSTFQPRQLMPAPPGLEVVFVIDEYPWFEVSSVIGIVVTDEVTYRNGRVLDHEDEHPADRASYLDAVIWDTKMGPTEVGDFQNVWYYTMANAERPTVEAAKAEHAERERWKAKLAQVKAARAAES